MNILVKALDGLDAFLKLIADASGYLFLVLMAVICFDVFTRKFGIQVPGLESTPLQELEWHLHTAIFAGWMGYTYVINSHPRVDSYTESLSLRKKAWIELTGCLVFALPYCLMLVHFGTTFVVTSFLSGEGSETPTGLSNRWIIKTVFFVGLVMLTLSVVTVMLRSAIFLFGGRWADRANLHLAEKPPSL